jgi:hypothetical protein
MNDFNDLNAQTRQEARKAKLKKSDLAEAISKVRSRK